MCLQDRCEQRAISTTHVDNPRIWRNLIGGDDCLSRQLRRFSHRLLEDCAYMNIAGHVLIKRHAQGMFSGGCTGLHSSIQMRPSLLKEIGALEQNPRALAIWCVATQTLPNWTERKAIMLVCYQNANAGERPQETLESAWSCLELRRQFGCALRGVTQQIGQAQPCGDCNHLGHSVPKDQ